MKKLLLILSLALMPFVVQAVKIKAIPKIANSSIEGRILSFSDTLVVMEPKLAPGQTLELTPEKVDRFIVSGIGKYYSEGGKFVPDKKTQTKLEKTQLSEIERAYGVNGLNERIANAFKATGDVCMGIGIPSLIAGSVLVGIGATAKDLKINSNCTTAGIVLLSSGAALTIVGIPLHVHGKRIGEFNFNYIGNGAGVSITF